VRGVDDEAVGPDAERRSIIANLDDLIVNRRSRHRDDLEGPWRNGDHHGTHRRPRGIYVTAPAQRNPTPGARVACNALDHVRADQSRHAGSRRHRSHLARCAVLDDPPVFQHDTPGGECIRVLKRMCHQQCRYAEVRENIPELHANTVPGRRIQRRKRLVEEQDLGLSRQRTGECHPLAFSAGNLAGAGAGQLGDSQPFKQVRPRAAGRKRNVAGHGQVREQAVVLWDVPDTTLLCTQPDPACAIEPRVRPAHDATVIRGIEAGDQAQQCRLPGARRTDDCTGLVADRQLDVEIERAAREGDVDVQTVHERRISFEANRIAALTMTSNTPIATAWSRFASKSA